MHVFDQHTVCGIPHMVTHNLSTQYICMQPSFLLHRQRTGFVVGDSTMMHWSSLGAVQVGVALGAVQVDGQI